MYMKKSIIVFLSTVAVLFTFGIGCVLADVNYSIGKITPNQPTGAGSTVGIIVGTLQWVGYAIAVGMLVFIGIKYVMASANEKADLKQSLVKYVIGAVLIVFATTIAKWVFSLNGGNEKVKAGTSTNGSGIAIET